MSVESGRRVDGDAGAAQAAAAVSSRRSRRKTCRRTRRIGSPRVTARNRQTHSGPARPGPDRTGPARPGPARPGLSALGAGRHGGGGRRGGAALGSRVVRADAADSVHAQAPAEEGGSRLSGRGAGRGGAGPACGQQRPSGPRADAAGEGQVVKTRLTNGSNMVRRTGHRMGAQPRVPRPNRAPGRAVAGRANGQGSSYRSSW